MSYTERNAKLALQIDTTPHWDQTFRLMAWWDSERVAQAKVMVVGAGALGNEVLKNLALLNVGHILIVDFDTVEYSNLSRSVLFRASDCMQEQLKCEVAAERIREINPNIKVQAINGDILLDVGLGVFRRMDVVIGCLDNRLARLFINQFCYKTNKTWIDGALENLSGQLDVYKPGISCYECQLTDVERQMIRYRLGCPDIARRNAAFGKIATTPISASIIGAMQAQEALKIVFNNEKQSMAGKQFKYDGWNFDLLTCKATELKEDCDSHIELGEVIEARNLSANSTVGEFLDWVILRFSDPDAVVHLGYEVVLEVTTAQSQETYSVLMAKFHLSEAVTRQYLRIPGELVHITQYTDRINRHFLKQDAPLRQLGIPPLHILTIEANGSFYAVELTGDESFLHFQ